MKKHWAIVSILGVFTLVLFFVWIAPQSSDVTLEFQGYDRSSYFNQFAKLILHNTTTKEIWIINTSENFRLSPPFLQRSKTLGETDVHGLRFQHLFSFFMEPKRLSPGESLSLEFRVAPGEPSKQAGIRYYVGNFGDDNEFLRLTEIPFYLPNVSTLQRAKNLFEKIEHWWKAPKPHKVWCSEWLSLPDNNSTNPVIKPSAIPAR